MIPDEEFNIASLVLDFFILINKLPIYTLDYTYWPFPSTQAKGLRVARSSYPEDEREMEVFLWRYQWQFIVTRIREIDTLKIVT